jgi:hypothetical protein
MENGSMFGLGGRIPITTYYRTISVDNKPTTVIIGPSKCTTVVQNAGILYKTVHPVG